MSIILEIMSLLSLMKKFSDIIKRAQETTLKYPDASSFKIGKVVNLHLIN